MPLARLHCRLELASDMAAVQLAEQKLGEARRETARVNVAQLLAVAAQMQAEAVLGVGSRVGCA